MTFRCSDQLPAERAISTCRPLDAAGVMDAMNASHVHQLLPRLLEGDAVLTVFTEHCLDCKVVPATQSSHDY